uniref:Uncharacterized protein n=1 Tax=Glossina pallidipes TaxID=7398 RepID=A0A1A9ZI60_GLOPL
METNWSRKIPTSDDMQYSNLSASTELLHLSHCSTLLLNFRSVNPCWDLAARDVAPTDNVFSGAKVFRKCEPVILTETFTKIRFKRKYRIFVEPKAQNEQIKFQGASRGTLNSSKIVFKRREGL